MRRTHRTATAGTVHHLAHRALAATLDWKPFRASVPVAHLLDLILLMAATTRTLFAVVTRHFRFSHETARRAVRENLPDLDTLTDRLTAALYHVLAFSRPDRRRRWVVAIDTHDLP